MRLTKIRILCLALMTSVILLVGCDKNRVFDQYKSLPGQWDKDSVVTFQLERPDSIQAYDLYINLRNTNTYEYSNIFLITHMNFPNGKVVVDTLEYNMAYPDGSWMGTGYGDSKESKLWYKQGVRFVEDGTYSFQIRQAMRKNGEENGITELKGITEVGLRVEKSNQNNSQ